GTPKGCVHFHRDILAAADSYARHVLQPSPDDRFGGHPTLAFTFGTGGLLVFPFRFGAATVLSGSFTPESMLETFSRQRVTIGFCAPTSAACVAASPPRSRSPPRHGTNGTTAPASSCSTASARPSCSTSSSRRC